MMMMKCFSREAQASETDNTFITQQALEASPHPPAAENNPGGQRETPQQLPAIQDKPASASPEAPTQNPQAVEA